ncbi:MAG TPA: aminotransferase class V-fold PLP-dependent enzyme, partial [Acidimicrobiales bacterium]|nr:aminotransferase class V-fold PLP-dependent enzyme [Acidimicrobiales bacterium]
RRSDALVAHATSTAAEFLHATIDEVAFGANMTTLNFALSRAASREWRAGDGIVCTQLDHDANVSPWLEIAHDKGLTVGFARIDGECRLDLEHLRSLVDERTRVVAYPWAANSVGTVTPVAEIAEIAHDAGALAWVDAVHYGPHGPIDVRAAGADVLICSPYKFYGPHLGLAFVRRELAEAWRPYKVRPADLFPVATRYQTGTLPHELLAGFVAAVRYLEEIGWEFVLEHEHELGRRFLDALPADWSLHGIPTMEGRVPTFAITHATLTPEEAATRLGERGFAVWHGNYYAVETMNALGLRDGAVRVGFVHYNTDSEVDRLLASLADLA